MKKLSKRHLIQELIKKSQVALKPLDLWRQVWQSLLSAEEGIAELEDRGIGSDMQRASLKGMLGSLERIRHSLSSLEETVKEKKVV